MKKIFSSVIAIAAACIPALAVTVNVQVPSGTKACYIVGDFNGWNTETAPQLERIDATHYRYDDPSVTSAALCKGYKYICGPGWGYVEKDANGGEVGNRTSIGNPDVVASWAAIYEVNESIKEFTLQLNGYSRQVQVLLPDGYDSSSASYPVIYYVGVKQRYSKAGDDSNPGDNFFSSKSWGVADRISGGTPAILVASYSFVAENVPYPHPTFAGSGASDAYLADFVGTLKDYIDTHYRTLAGPANTSIVGADLGGVLAVYATLTRPDVFGRCLAFSPMSWIVEEQLCAAAQAFNGSNEFVLTYGTSEPASMRSMVTTLAGAIPGAQMVPITGGLHNDVSWGSAFSSFYGYLTGSVAAPSTAVAARQEAPRRASDITATDYQLYSRTTSSSSCTNSDLSIDNTAAITLIPNYRRGSADVTAKSVVRVVPKADKNYFYSNIKNLSTDAFLKSSPLKVSFSPKKSSDSWVRIVIYEDESVETINASSTGFRVVTPADNVTMSLKNGFTVSAAVEFGTADKSFKVHYGSVNSNSDMGAITETMSVSASCTAATIDYDFLSNRVTVTETSWGDLTTDDYVVSAFQAIPSVTRPGNSSNVVIRIDCDRTLGATLTSSYNYGTETTIPLTATGNNEWTADISSLKAGLYTLRLSLTSGSSTKSNVSNVCIRVTDDAPVAQQFLTVNAYDGIDWETIGRYKANFHTHTSQSFDTNFNTDYVVDAYRNAGYKVLALTDHDANPYPWDFFDIYNPASSARNAEEMGMLAIPGVELSKDNRNNWSESTGGEFNHHNDFFTGRKGQEFASLRESYAYTRDLGGLQIINHPGQYWSLDREYTPGEKNSPEWHAENFRLFNSLIGLEVYNQGNRRPNDRILWDQILEMTMPERPVWGYSCDDTHTAEQYFRNYQYMLMPELSETALRACMEAGKTIFSYEYTGSGNALAPVIESVDIDLEAHTITINTPATNIKWIAGSDRQGGPSTRKSTAVGRGKTFDFNGFGGSYVRAIVFNEYGETCLQPFGFSPEEITEADLATPVVSRPTMYPNPCVDSFTVSCPGGIDTVEIHSLTGALCGRHNAYGASTITLDASAFAPGIYVVTVDGTPLKLIKR